MQINILVYLFIFCLLRRRRVDLQRDSLGEPGHEDLLVVDLGAFLTSGRAFCQKLYFSISKVENKLSLIYSFPYLSVIPSLILLELVRMKLAQSEAVGTTSGGLYSINFSSERLNELAGLGSLGT